jgi:hypothetical protein
MQKMTTTVRLDGAGYAEQYPEDVRKIREALARAGYAVSDEDAAIAYHNWGEDEFCAGWHNLGWNDKELVAGCLRYLRPASETDTDTLRAQLAAEKARADAAERSRDELGIQLAACQERLRLAMAVVDAARVYLGDPSVEARWRLVGCIAALDAVPGDALQPVSGAYRSDIGTALDRAHEASGVVTGAPFDEPQNGVKVTP